MPQRLQKSLSAACCMRQRVGRVRSSPWAERQGFRMLGASHPDAKRYRIDRYICILHACFINTLHILLSCLPKSLNDYVIVYAQLASEERFQGMSLKSFGMQQHAQLGAM